MFHIEFMSPHVFWTWGPILALLLLGFAWYNLRVLDGTRSYWGDKLLLNAFSPRNQWQTISLWVQWAAFMLGLVFCLAGPNISQAPQMVQSGAVQNEFVIDASVSMGAEDYRPYLPTPNGGPVPDNSYQWGTRIDAASYFIRQDLLPQLAGNEAGLVTVVGAGYNMWDVTRDLSGNGAFMHVLNNFVKMRSAPGGGLDLVSGLQTALDEFDLITDLQKKGGDKTPKVRFITLFSDGGFTGDQGELTKILNQINERQIRLLIVAVGGTTPMTVSKFDDRTQRRTKESFEGTTRVNVDFLKQIKAKVKDATLIVAPPGTKHIEYSYPQQAGGLYAKPSRANLKPWFLLIDLALFLSITIGGGGLPRWKYIVPQLRGSLLAAAVSSVKLRLMRRVQ